MNDQALNSFFPALVDPGRLPSRVLCFAPHPDDEVLGCGGLLALLAERGGEIGVIVMTDGGGAGGDAALSAARAEESRRAAAALGLPEPVFWNLKDGGLGKDHQLVGRIQAELERADPDLVLGPSPFESHPDHRSASAALHAALAQGRERRVLLYGVNAPPPYGVLIDTTRAADRKRAALACFQTQLAARDLIELASAADRARTVNVDDRRVACAEAFIDLPSSRAPRFWRASAALLECVAPHGAFEKRTSDPWPKATAVLSAWNKREELRANLNGLRAQTRPFDRVIVVDNCSSDGTADMVRSQFPEVDLIVMPHSRYGACETFNIGFAQSTTPLTAILDDDIVMPPQWLELATKRLLAEPPTTAIVSTKVVEPGMPDSYRQNPTVNRERYMSTFRGCASLARTSALREAGYYDERLFIYGNERDLTCRLMNLGYRVLQYPGVETFHRTPFGIKLGKRSLYYHSRNVWLTMLKYAPLSDLVRMPWLVLTQVVLRPGSAEQRGEVTDATGTIGIGRALRETPGGVWIVAKAAFSVLANLPYCLRRRAPVRSADFELPLR
jgi:LmbE family N-acetylglucosaminyl deacetylase/GT2 family glycosyltransferase